MIRFQDELIFIQIFLEIGHASYNGQIFPFDRGVSGFSRLKFPATKRHWSFSAAASSCKKAAPIPIREASVCKINDCDTSGKRKIGGSQIRFFRF